MISQNKNSIAVLIVIATCVAVVYMAMQPKRDMATPVDSAPVVVPTESKLDIEVVCASALSYMTFTDGASADVFVKECKEGKHPEVIERYKVDMGLGDGTTI